MADSGNESPVVDEKPQDPPPASLDSAASEEEKGKEVEDGGPVPIPVSYPLRITYCGNCSLPPEYCEYFPDYERCRKWLEAHLPSEMEGMTLGGGAEGEAKSGRQKRGGKGLVKVKKPTGKAGPKRILLSRAPRGKKKSVTVVVGLGTCGIDLKVAAKFLSSRFACGASVTGEDEIVIQGDVKDDLFDVLPEKWPEDIYEDYIEDLGDQKR